MNQNIADELVTMMTEGQRLLQQLFNCGELPSESYNPRMKAPGVVNSQPLNKSIKFVPARGRSCRAAAFCRVLVPTARGREKQRSGEQLNLSNPPALKSVAVSQ